MFKSKEIYFFLMYVFLIPLVCILLKLEIQILDKGLCGLFIFAVQAASPMLAAIIVTIQFNGLTVFKKFIKEKYINNIKLKYILLGIIFPLAILSLAKITSYGLGYKTEFIKVLNTKKLLIIFWALVAEELGWRGYLQDKLYIFKNEWLIPIITGSIWFLWHYNFYLIGTMDSPLLLFAYGCIAESYGYYTITKLARGNIIPASLWHFLGNFFFNIYLFSPKWNNNSMVPYLVATLFYSLNIIFFLWVKKRKKIFS